MVLALFLASLGILVLAALAFGSGFFLAALAFTLAGFLMAGAVFGASAVLAVGSQADAVGASHLAVLHALLFALLHGGTGGVGSDSVFCLSVAVAGNHCECKCDSEESVD
jgi:hypothetical protein